MIVDITILLPFRALGVPLLALTTIKPSQQRGQGEVGVVSGSADEKGGVKGGDGGGGKKGISIRRLSLRSKHFACFSCLTSWSSRTGKSAI